MHGNVVQSVKRLGWRFTEAVKKNNTFRINQTDVDAINNIAKYVEQTQAQQFQENELFAKLYILVYAKMIEHYNTDILDDRPRKAMGQLLTKSLEETIEDFRERLNDSCKYEFIRSILGEIKHPVTLSDEKRDSNTRKIKKALKSKENQSKITGEVWDFETVQTNLIAEVNNILNIHRHG